ncbi:hypothetical protein SteCoe_14006 [Stentor coeruleus]|uniref:Uncharacterized protein n=1 Tax=Stentor coeruleus TaxID=5963 RepID=A0A1R2C725_9CILI|nr:hypothetical protein SteCoe_14006 [Stentor coeruleus]
MENTNPKSEETKVESTDINTRLSMIKYTYKEIINEALNLVGKKVFTNGCLSNIKLSRSLDTLISELNLYKSEISDYNKKNKQKTSAYNEEIESLIKRNAKSNELKKKKNNEIQEQLFEKISQVSQKQNISLKIGGSQRELEEKIFENFCENIEKMINELGDKIEKRLGDNIEKMINDFDDKINNYFIELEKKIEVKGMSIEISQVKIKVERLDTKISYMYSFRNIL